MDFPCRSETCKKKNSTKFNRNKPERIKKSFEDNGKRLVRYNKTIKLFTSPKIDCTASSKYKSNMIKHLKSCSIIKINKETGNYNKTCSICNKSFLKKSSRDCHIRNIHKAPAA